MTGFLHRWLARGVSATLMMSAAVALAPAVANAGVAFTVVATIPPTVSVGQTGVPSSLTITNSSANAPGQNQYDFDIMRVDTITIVPSCGTMAVGSDCPVGFRDPGVIVPSPLTGTGRSGSASGCGGKTFTFAVIDAAQGKYAVTTAPPLQLGASSGTLVGKQCIIDYTSSVLKSPSVDANAAQVGLQTSQKAGVTGTDTCCTNIGATGTGVGTAATTVAKATPTIASVASGGVAAGAGTLTDTATISGLVSPVPGGATVDFQLYGPDDATCARTPIFSSLARPITVNGAVGTATSAPFTPTAAGTYRWRAFYSGDANNAAVSAPCNAPGESVVVALAPPPPPAPPPAPPPPPPPLPDRTATKVVLGAPAAVSPIKREVSTRVTCPATEPGGCQGSASFTLLFRSGTRNRQIAVGSATFTLKAGARKTLRRKLTRAQFRRLRGGRARKLRVKATSRDAAGNVAKSTRTSNLRVLVLA